MMENAIVLRNAAPADAVSLGNVYCYAWKEGYKNIIPQQFLDSLTVEKSAPPPDRINCDNNYVAEYDGKIVGLANYGQGRDAESANWGELRSIYVLADFWGKGVGKSLFQAASAVLEDRGYAGFYLWVLKENYRARRFYEKMGMVCSGDEKTVTIGGIELVESRYVFEFSPIYEFRNVAEQDYEFVYQVKKQAYQKYVEENYGSWDEDKQRMYFERFINTYKEGAYIITQKGKDIGFYNGSIISDEQYEVGNICIVPEYQRRGIGSAIIRDIIAENRDKEIKIQYFKQNPVGKLYERLGFELCGETAYHFQMVRKR